MTGAHPAHGGGDQARRPPSTGFAGMTAGAFPELVRAPGTSGPPDSVARLDRLELLHGAGALTDAEYDDARAALLEAQRRARTGVPSVTDRPLGA